ncbi:MAG: 1-acyl-sn-glycerol-3-phosphate acyltransferase [Rhodobacteraceae bacterium]|nr:1-acyl-sn-glycerol-3-phosphate acyltransferase [Paracoccaceae bacterium]
MTQIVQIPLWLLLLVLVLALIALWERMMIPSVRWFFRRRMEKVVERLNKKLDVPIQPFKLARRYDMIQRLIYDPQVAQAVVDQARATETPERVVFEEAAHYAREIVPTFSASAYFGFATRMARFISMALFRVRLGHFDEAELRKVDPDAAVIFVMNHRSNMDYLLVTFLAAERSALSYAVGEWARVWPLSRLIKAMGAYFVRRKSRNDLYRKVLARYVRLSTDNGVTQAMFPEGGLSLTGAPAAPKMGLLKYLIDEFDPEGRDIVFVPVALNYDRVLEDRILINAGKEESRRFKAGLGVVARNIGHQLWLRITGRYHRFGYAAVSFGCPLSLKEFSTGRAGDLTMPLAEELMSQIAAIIPILPVPAVCWLMLQNTQMTRAEVEQGMARMVTDLPMAHTHVPRDDQAYATEVGLRNLIERNVLTLSGETYSINPENAELVNFYANSIRHLMPDALPNDSAAANGISAPAGS